MKISGQHTDNQLYDLPKDEDRPKSKWLRFIKAYRRVPLLRKIDPVRLGMLLLIILIETLLIKLFPPGECTCEDQFTDQKLEVMARAGNQEVKHYLAQKDNPINCAGRRKELLDKLEKAKRNSQPGQ